MRPEEGGGRGGEPWVGLCCDPKAAEGSGRFWGRLEGPARVRSWGWSQAGVRAEQWWWVGVGHASMGEGPQ